jgi:hypothetical protein
MHQTGFLSTRSTPSRTGPNESAAIQIAFTFFCITPFRPRSSSPHLRVSPPSPQSLPHHTRTNTFFLWTHLSPNRAIASSARSFPSFWYSLVFCILISLITRFNRNLLVLLFVSISCSDSLEWRLLCTANKTANRLTDRWPVRPSFVLQLTAIRLHHHPCLLLSRIVRLTCPRSLSLSLSLTHFCVQSFLLISLPFFGCTSTKSIDAFFRHFGLFDRFPSAHFRSDFSEFQIALSLSHITDVNFEFSQTKFITDLTWIAQLKGRLDVLDNFRLVLFSPPPHLSLTPSLAYCSLSECRSRHELGQSGRTLLLTCFSPASTKIPLLSLRWVCDGLMSSSSTPFFTAVFGRSPSQLFREILIRFLCPPS